MSIYEVTVTVFSQEKPETIIVEADSEENATEYVCQNEFTDGNEAIITGVELIVKK